MSISSLCVSKLRIDNLFNLLNTAPYLQIIMKLVAQGESRQESVLTRFLYLLYQVTKAGTRAHEQIRILSQEAANTVKNEVRVTIFMLPNSPFYSF